MSALSRARKRRKDICYHLYKENVGDIQYSVRITEPYTITFREIIKKATVGILDLRPTVDLTPKAIQTYHNLANSFRTALFNNNNSHLSMIHLKIAPKMVEPRPGDDQSQNSIERTANKLLRNNHSSIPLNAKWCDYDQQYNVHTSLYILWLTHPRYPLSSMSTTTVNNSTSTINSLDIDDGSEDKIKHNNENDDPNPQIIRKKKPKILTKPKKVLKKQKKNKKRKRVNKKKKKKHQNYNKRRYLNTDLSTDEDEWDYEETDDDYSEEDDMYTDDDEDFHPPIKRKKFNLSNVKNQLRKKNPTSLRGNGMRIINNRNNRATMIARHRQFINAPRLASTQSSRQRMRQQRIEKKPNHLVILLDISRSMTSSLIYPQSNYRVSRLEMAIKYIQKYIQSEWRKSQEDTLISFSTFGGGLDIWWNTLKCNAGSIKKLMLTLLNIKKENELSNLETETALYDAVLELIKSFKSKNIQKFKNSRILLFTDGENWSNAPKFNDIKMALKTTKITIDCVQCTRSERDNTSLRKICCEYSSHGRFWNPLTLADWDVIFTSFDFLMPYKRGYVFDLTVED